jgi:uracil-DNA glycosylase family 4
MVVSEIPSRAAWKLDLGRNWEQDLFAGRERGVPHTLCRWLGIDKEDANRIFFWIHRANCAVSKGKEYSFQHCTSKFLDQAVELVGPKLILVLGKVAATYFFQFEKFDDLIGEVQTYSRNNIRYKCIVLCHPSPRAKKCQKRSTHLRSVQLAKEEIAGLILLP